MKTVLIAGGTGAIGRRLVQLLWLRSYKIIVLTRHLDASLNKNLCEYAVWNPGKQEIDKNAIAQADYIINLAGAGISDTKWTSERKKVILESRVDSCKIIVEAISRIENKVKAVINASAIGYYGSDKGSGMDFNETFPSADDFLGLTCKKWEEAIAPVSELNKRLVILRTGVVLDKKSGIYKEFKMPLGFRIAPVLGKGTQIVSWIHIDDICRIYIEAIENVEMQGVYNAASPHPITMKELAIALAENRYGNYFLRLKVPGFILKIFLGEMAESMVLQGATINVDKLLNSRFTFQYPDIATAAKSFGSSEA